MANMNITGILEKMTGKDKENRYMATSDLLSELNKESFKADHAFEPKLTDIIIQQLEDASGDVSGLAVKCLAPLAKKVSEDRVVEMTNKLGDKLLNGKDQHRYTVSMGLKTIIVELTTPSLAEKILVSLAPQLINGVTSEKKAEIKCECLDILSDVLDRFGNVIAKDHAYMLTALLSQLSSTQASVRKKSVLCIASLALCLSDDLLGKAILEVSKLLQNRNSKSEVSRTNIQMISALSRSVGYRVGPHLAQAVPLLINYCTSASENDEELREYSLQALESFMLRCQRDISPYCQSILNLALEYVSYDPNFTDSMEDDIDDEVQDEEDDDESGDVCTKDADASWKVRRASAKCLSAIIVSGLQTLSKMYQEACPKLIDRFRERDKNVKMDIFNTFIELLRQTANVTKGQGDIDESSPRWLLKHEVPKVVKSINCQLREKSIKTNVGAFLVLKELVIVLPDCLADHFGFLVPRIEKALNDKSSTSNLKIEALAFTRIVMASHSPSLFHPYIQALSGPILSAIGDRYYKVTAEALLVCGELVRVLRPKFETCSIDISPYIGPIYKAILTRLANQDQDQEVNECAISCMSLVISTFVDGLESELPLCLPILVDRMGNEITRLTAVKAFAVIASSPLRIDLKCVLDRVVSELTAFLRKANRALRHATLGTLNSLVLPYGGEIGLFSYEAIIAELSTLISGIDLHMANLALELCSTIMAMRKLTENIGMTHKILPHALLLMKRYGLQGQVSKELEEFFTSLILCKDITSGELLDSIISSASISDFGSIAEREIITITQCVRQLSLVDDDLEGILNGMVNSNNSPEKRLVALMCYHEIAYKGGSNDYPPEPPIVSPVLISPPVGSPTSNLKPYNCQPEPDQVLPLRTRNTCPDSEELLPEVLVRIPPENAAFLFRAPAVSHAWRNMVTSEHFRQSYKKVHRSPPVLGLMHNRIYPEEARYISISHFQPGRSVQCLWNVRDSRHGFALLETVHQGHDGLVGYCIWHPVTRQLCPLFLRDSKLLFTKGAVMCGTSDCLHSDCRSTGFSVLFIGKDGQGRNMAMSYSSDKTWSDSSYLDDDLILNLDVRAPVLIDQTLYFLDKSEHILVYELDSGLSLISRPKFTEYDTLFKTDDILSLAYVESRSLFYYQREVTPDLKWIPFHVVNLLSVLPERCLNKLAAISVIGYAEGTNNIVLKTVSSILIFDVVTDNVKEVKEVTSHGSMITIYPHVSYLIPVDSVGAGKAGRFLENHGGEA